MKFHVTNKNLSSIHWIITPRDGKSFLRWITGNHNSVIQSQKLYFLLSPLNFAAVFQKSSLLLHSRAFPAVHSTTYLSIFPNATLRKTNILNFHFYTRKNKIITVPHVEGIDHYIVSIYLLFKILISCHSYKWGFALVIGPLNVTF